MGNPLSNRKWVERTPIATTLLLESANVGQILRMFRERSALGQSLIAWALVWAALLLWLNFYRVITPDQRWAKYATGFGVCMNTCVMLTIIYFRYLV